MPYALIYAQRPIDSYFESSDYGIDRLVADGRWQAYSPFTTEHTAEQYFYRADKNIFQTVHQVQYGSRGEPVTAYYAVWIQRLKQLKPLVEGDRFALQLVADTNASLQHTYLQVRLTQGYAGFAERPGAEWRDDRVDALLTPSVVAVTGMSSLFDVRRMPYAYAARDEWRTVMLERPGDDLVRETGIHLIEWAVQRDELFAQADADDKVLLRSLLEGTRTNLAHARSRAARQRYQRTAWLGWLPLLLAILLGVLILLWFLGYLPVPPIAR